MERMVCGRCLRTDSITGRTRDCLFGGERSGVGTGGFAAEVENVGAFVEHAEGLRDGALRGVFGRVVEAAVGEGVGCDVEDAHDEGSSAERERAGAEMPVVVSAGREGHGGILVLVARDRSLGARLRGWCGF